MAIASFIGTTIEWYDFFLYGTASALVFGRLFFPKYDEMTGVMASYSTYAVGFIARPIGGMVCGHFGDRIGRKSMLIFTLSLMGVATALIGLLPTYDQIGVWAPALLVALRIAQGFAVGGEWGGAVLMAVEHSPKGRRGFYGSWPQVGVPVGLLLSTGAFDSERVRLISVNSGGSVIASLTYSPTPTSRTLNRNATRHPHERRASSGSAEISAKAPVESSRPTGTPTCGQLP